MRIQLLLHSNTLHLCYKAEKDNVINAPKSKIPTILGTQNSRQEGLS